ncbi:MAG: hypothetical protein M3O50_04015 [Myxococcota bacterium]|nr:hypothetical protein [Myxococcota bacterium]
MDAPPLLFTVQFRRKMAELSQQQRRDWLASLAHRLRTAPVASAVSQELREVARGCRLPLVDAIERQLGPFDPRHLEALLDVPRERFVRAEDIERSADDAPLPLDDEGFATISAPHAYLLSFRLLELALGDELVELGAGSGYGAALAAFIVGPKGRVITFEIDAVLASAAGRALAGEPTVTIVHGDAMASAGAWRTAKKVVVTFAIESVPRSWLDALPEGGRLVAPVGAKEHEQQLVLVQRQAGRIVESVHGTVRYVQNRSEK